MGWEHIFSMCLEEWNMTSVNWKFAIQHILKSRLYSGITDNGDVCMWGCIFIFLFVLGLNAPEMSAVSSLWYSEFWVLHCISIFSEFSKMRFCHEVFPIKQKKEER